jgi:hypothetical protein
MAGRGMTAAYRKAQTDYRLFGLDVSVLFIKPLDKDSTYED